MSIIYLDHSATTPVDEQVWRVMQPYFRQHFGNASSIHSLGLKAAEAIARARQQVADFVGGQPEEIVFTSGATESDNLAIFGIAQQLQKDGYQLSDLHFMTTSVEHPAVSEPFQRLQQQGAEVTFLPVEKNGVVDLSTVTENIKDNTVFLSVVYVNSEVGARQPIAEIGRLVKKIRAERRKAKNKLPLFFHTDAVQAANFFSCQADELGVDLLSLSGHKVYGPKGVGALYVRQGVKLVAQQIGGHQENNRRSGTYNTPTIVGMGEALELAALGREENNRRLRHLQDLLIKGIQAKIPDAYLNTDPKQASPAHVNFAFPGAEGEAVLMELDLAGICVSTGSACASHSLQSSPTLLAMGVPKGVVHGAIRMTLGKHNTEEEIKKVLKVLPEVVAKYRAMSPEGLEYTKE